MRSRRCVLTLAAAALGAGLVFAAIGAGEAGGGGGCRGEPVADGRGTAVRMTAACFTPVILRVDPGTNVTWLNESGSHTVTGANAAWGSFEATTRDLTHRFDEPGIYPYFCFLHPGMIGAVVVGDASQAPRGSAVSMVGFSTPEAPAAGQRGPEPPPATSRDHALSLALVAAASAAGAGGAAFVGSRRRQA